MISSAENFKISDGSTSFGIRFRTVASYLLLVAFALGIGIYSILNINALSTKLGKVNEVNSVSRLYLQVQSASMTKPEADVQIATSLRFCLRRRIAAPIVSDAARCVNLSEPRLSIYTM